MTGDAGFPDSLVVTYQNSGGTNYLVVQDNGVNLITPNSIWASSVGAIQIAADAGDDIISLANVIPTVFTSLFSSPVVDGGSGNDHITGSYLADVLYGVGGADTLIGINGDDHLYGGNDDDLLYGDYGSDSASFVFDDILEGGAGKDKLYGDQGADDLYGDDDIDDLFGNSGNDDLYSGNGADNLHTGTGTNTIWDIGARDTGGEDDIVTAPGHDTVNYSLLTGGTGVGIAIPDGIEDIIGSPFRDVFEGNDSINSIFGGGGDDDLDGKGGNDFLVGGPGSDLIEGGTGDDQISIFALADGPDFGYTDISGSDTIDFSGVGGSNGVSFTLPSSFEILFGTQNGDNLTGNSLANLLWGLGGNDHFVGGAGVDSLIGGAGTDTYDGDPQDSFTQ